MEAITKEDIKNLRSWGSSVLKLAALAVGVEELMASAAAAEKLCAGAEQAAVEIRAARDLAQAEHQKWLDQLARDAETHRQSTMNKHARMVEEYDKELSQLAARKDKLAFEVQDLMKQKGALVDEEAKLKESVASMKKYLKQAGALAGSI